MPSKKASPKPVRRRPLRGFDALFSAAMAPAVLAARERAKALRGEDDSKVPPAVARIEEARNE